MLFNILIRRSPGKSASAIYAAGIETNIREQKTSELEDDQWSNIILLKSRKKTRPKEIKNFRNKITEM